MVRSQIAEAYYNKLTFSKDSTSAGTAAVNTNFVSRRAVRVMDEVGISMDGQYSKQLAINMIDNVDKVVVFPVSSLPDFITSFQDVEYWDTEDRGFGHDDSIALDRIVRDEIREKVKALIGINHEHTD
jgi:protein-tyrosine-phosphatase